MTCYTLRLVNISKMHCPSNYKTSTVGLSPSPAVIRAEPIVLNILMCQYMSRQDWSQQTKETVYPPLFFPTLQMGRKSVPPTLFPHLTDGEKQCTPHSFSPPYRWGERVYPPLFSPPYRWGKTVYPPLFFPTLRMGRKSGLHSFSPLVRWKSESVPPTLFSHCNKMEKKSVPPTLFFPIIEGEKVQRVRNYPYPLDTVIQFCLILATATYYTSGTEHGTAMYWNMS